MTIPFGRSVLTVYYLKRRLKASEEACSGSPSKAGLVPNFGRYGGPILFREAVGHCRQKTVF